jgi:hypothetical protein
MDGVRDEGSGMPNRYRSAAVRLAIALSSVLAVSPWPVDGQTRVQAPKNKFTPEQDVKLGLEAAAEVEKAMPLIGDDAIAEYVTGLGERLVAVAPPELDYPEFRYSFTVVDQKAINAFALPGGPMFLNRGMIEAADAEAGVAGVMAHELAHVLLRHGTANVTKAQNPWLQLGSLAGVVAGAIVGGGAGQAIATGTQFGLGTVLLKYSREYEKQADLLGAQLMARAGYDPRQLARMFEKIAAESKGGAPEWMSSHPNPGNRTAYIEQEAALLEVADREHDEAGFERVRDRLAAMPPSPTPEEVARRARSRGETAPADMGTLGEPVPLPSARYRTARGVNILSVEVPDNWLTMSSNNRLRFVPRNAYGQVDGQTVFTHGVELGMARASTRDLESATRRFIDGLVASNPGLRLAGQQETVRLSQRTAIATPLAGRSATGGEERIGVYTTFLADGSLFYYVWVVPGSDYAAYRNTFARVGRSIRLNDVR